MGIKTDEITTLHTLDVELKSDVALLQGQKAVKTVPFDCTIVGYSVVCVDPWNTPVSVAINIKRFTYQNYPTTGQSIVGSKRPTIVNGTKTRSTNLAVWMTALAQHDQLVFGVSAATDAKHVIITLYVRPR